MRMTSLVGLHAGTQQLGRPSHLQSILRFANTAISRRNPTINPVLRNLLGRCCTATQLGAHQFPRSWGGLSLFRSFLQSTTMAAEILQKKHRFILVSDLDWTMVSSTRRSE